MVEGEKSRTSLSSPYAWALLAVMAAAFVAAFFSLQFGVFLLLFAAVGWWVWLKPEEAFGVLVILSPLLPMFKITQTIGTVTLVKDVIIIVMFGRLVVWPLLTKRLPYRRSFLLAPIVALVAWTAFGALRADVMTLGILRAREIVLYALLYFAVLYLPVNRQVWRQRFMWVAVAFGVTTVLAVYQWFFAGDSAVLRFDPARQIWIPRISSTFAHPSVYGEYLVALFALFAALGIYLNKWWTWGLMLLTLPLIFLTYSRAVWIALVVAGGTMLVVLCVSWIRSQYFLHGYASVAQRANRAAARPRTVKEGTLTDHTARSAQHPRSKHWLLIGLAGLVIVIVGLLIFRFTPAGPLLRSAFDPTYKSNLERLEFAVRLIAPMTNLEALFGRGLGDVVEQNFRTVRVGLGAITEGASREVQLAKNRTLVDNQYLKTFVEMGLIGLLIYAWLFWRFAKGAWQLVREGGERHKKIIGLWSAGFLAAFVVQGFFIDIWDIFPTNAMFWIVGGLLAAALTPMRDEDLRHTDSSAKNRA